MAQILGGTYEIISEIGSGGFGVVYLAYHTRLNKKVVLKADKKKISTKPEILRREVDVLKTLSHQYIPQVYDFFTDGNNIYTVMDYIEGESLNKPLERGEHFSQPQVIKWGRQLLEALDYMHSPIHGNPPHGFVHSDIKPANIMLRPNGDICLIDFNIALAIGEVNIVGASAGYASPEHYGQDYSFNGLGSGQSTMRMVSSTGGLSSSSSTKRVMPDVRSDIYSVGATLYHLLSGVRPAKDARSVQRLPTQIFSPQLVAIITKSMNPNPDLRYQSAREMLDALNSLHINDERVLKLKKSKKIAFSVCAVGIVAGLVMTFGGLRQMQLSDQAARQQAQEAEEAATKRAEEEESAKIEAQAAAEAEEAQRLEAEAAEEAERAAKEAEQTAKEALELISESESSLDSGNALKASSLAAEALELDTIYNAQAQSALTNALGVYNLSDGFKSHISITLPSEPMSIALSPEGTRIAAMCSGTLTIYDTESGECLASLESDPSAMAAAVFLNEQIIYYSGNNAIRAYDIDAQTELWSGERATNISVSADGSTVAALYKDETFATVYNAVTGEVKRTVDFYGLKQSYSTSSDKFISTGGNLFALNSDGSMLAASFDGGALWVFNTLSSDDDVEILDESDYTRFSGGFCGPNLAVAATNADASDSIFVVFDMAALEQLGGMQSSNAYYSRADESGIYVWQNNLASRMDLEESSETELAFTGANINAFDKSGEYTVVSSEDGKITFFGSNATELDSYENGITYDAVEIAGDRAAVSSAYSAELRIFKLQTHSDALMFSYDPEYEHSEARLNADGTTVMLFDNYAFRLYSIDGAAICETELPDADKTYDQQYRRDGNGSYLEVIYTDGLVRKYSADDGSLLSEEYGDVPDESYTDEFETDNWKIVAPLHGTPEVYDKETGEFIMNLESDDYLTYVTQAGDYVITEYVSSLGERYGLLLDADGKTLAKLPSLCDILSDGTLVFDDMMGNLRQSRIYSASELLALAK